jgi:hypothetical protein
MNNFRDFPDEVHQVLKELRDEYKIKMKKETHYDAIDRELQWYDKNRLYRLNFDFSGSPSFITVHMLITKFVFPFFLFPLCSKTTWEKFADIPLGLSKEKYKEIIKKYINQTKQKE